MDAANEFSKKVVKFIKAIPKGKVATYGQIAKLAGKPQGSRGVAWILHSSSKAHALPWQRVINSQGKISFPKDSAEFNQQKRLLKKEGLVFVDDRIDMKKYQWKKKPAAKRPGLSLRLFS